MWWKIQFLISFQFLIALAHWDGAYFSNADDGFKVYNNWMQQIPNNRLLTELALPGTHDSSTFTSNIPFIRTQVITFAEQLKYGIRFFDIRIRHSKNIFSLVHSIRNLGLKFSDFLDDVTQFLRDNPSEVVLFRLKEDKKPGNNTRSMYDTLQAYLHTYKAGHLWETSSGGTLGNARGKFLIISDNMEFHSFGVQYNRFHKQDMYSINTIWDQYDKWVAIRNHLDEARNGNVYQFYINYLSASGGVLPYFVASGHVAAATSAPRLPTGLTTPLFKSYYPDFPRVGCVFGICTIAFEGTNTLAKNYLLKHPKQKRSVGVVAADFPGTELIKTIIDDNF